MIELKEIIEAIRKQRIRYTYIMKSKYLGDVVFKIGISYNPLERLKTIKSQSFIEDVKLMASIPYDIEKFLHKKLEEYSDHNEWFKDCDDIRLLIQVFRGISTNIGYFQTEYLFNKRDLGVKIDEYFKTN